MLLNVVEEWWCVAIVVLVARGGVLRWVVCGGVVGERKREEQEGNEKWEAIFGCVRNASHLCHASHPQTQQSRRQKPQ